MFILSISLLNKIQEGSVDAVKDLKVLKEKNKILEDFIMMIDEVYLQKDTQYQG